MEKTLSSVGEVVSALGGLSAVAKLTERKYSAAAQWPYLGSFPSNTYFVMTDALTKIGARAPASLWGMTGAEPQSEKAAP